MKNDPQPRKIIIYFYNRLFDPLIQGNFWVFIDDYLKMSTNEFQFHLVTYENSEFPLSKKEKDQIKTWKRKKISWSSLKWHPGNGIANKAKDIISGFTTVFKLRLKGYKYVISYNSVAGSYAYLFARLLNMRLYLYTYEPHSEYAIDNGLLHKKSLQYKILHYLEKRSAHFASVISSGTCFMQDRIEREWKVSGRFFKIPSVTNCRKFFFDQKIREKITQAPEFGSLSSARRAECGADAQT